MASQHCEMLRRSEVDEEQKQVTGIGSSEVVCDASEGSMWTIGGGWRVWELNFIGLRVNKG